MMSPRRLPPHTTERIAVRAQPPRRESEGDAPVIKSSFRNRYTGETEWYTPPEHVEAARRCLGVIDLDPASSVIAQETVRAARFLTKEDDGLSHEWRGRVFLNPPYSRASIARFVNKLLTENAAGRVTEAILVTHNHSDTKWFHAALDACAAICLTRGRVRFVSANGNIAKPTQGQAFFYFGGNLDRFRAAFTQFGFIVPIIRDPLIDPRSYSLAAEHCGRHG